MLAKLWKNKLRVAIVLLLVFMLALVRIYEDALFYDPFGKYFMGSYLNLPFPAFNGFELFFGMFSRYLLNAVISLFILYVLFRDARQIRFASMLYLIFFIILIACFFAIVTFSDSQINFTLFYVRRFLIQPIFVLLFIPAFYYQRMMAKNNIP